MTAKPRIEDEEILRLYANGVRDFTGYRIWIGDIGQMNLSGVNFSGQDLSETLLDEFNLSRANLSGAIMNQACLDRANLREANLTGAILTMATLWGTNLIDANLTGACLRAAEICKSNLTNAILVGCEIERILLKENIYQNTTWIDGSIRNQ